MGEATDEAASTLDSIQTDRQVSTDSTTDLCDHILNDDMLQLQGHESRDSMSMSREQQNRTREMKNKRTAEQENGGTEESPTLLESRI